MKLYAWMWTIFIIRILTHFVILILDDQNHSYFDVNIFKEQSLNWIEMMNGFWAYQLGLLFETDVESEAEFISMSNKNADIFFFHEKISCFWRERSLPS